MEQVKGMTKAELRQAEIEEEIAGQFSTILAIANGNAAMMRAVGRQENNCPGWSKAARQMIVKYPKAEFLIEDVREWAYANGLTKPDEPRAWGGPTTIMINQGVLIPNGSAKCRHKDSHGAVNNKWRKVLTGQEFYGHVTADESISIMLKEAEAEKERKAKEVIERRVKKKNNPNDF